MSNASTRTSLDIRQLFGAGDTIHVFATATYGDGQTVEVRFAGSRHGVPGPVVMDMGPGHQYFVTDPARFGDTFGIEWVRRFYS